MRSAGIFILLSILFLSCNKNLSTEIFIEAESFQNKGGWLVDPQFVEQMGSPYLLAHGLGYPVKNASTKLEYQVNGDYYIWARTKNWAPGNWEAPGKFSLLINGQLTDSILGTHGDWNWQFAGKLNLKKNYVQVELKDLTGFEGRCDAIYLSIENKPPPDKPEELAIWRKNILKEEAIPSDNEEFDLIVVGGGIAGCAASIAAAEQGLKVALVHDRPVPGGNASSEIRVHTEGITWHSDRILKMINTKHWPNGSPDAKQDDKKRLSTLKTYSNISLFFNWRAYTVTTQNDSITSVYARHTSTGERKRFKAPYYIDCTGDGWIGYWAGAEYMYGRECTSTFDEKWEKYGELWSPQKADNRIMGSSVLWRTKDKGKEVSFPEVPWALEVAGNYSATLGTWNWEFSRDDVHQIEDAEMIRDHMFRAIYGSFYNAKQKPENARIDLEWVSYLVGKRESRRLVGDYIYTFNDARLMREFPDGVIKEIRAVDVHYQQNLLDPEKPDFLSEANYYRVDFYILPYRTLYSRNIKNMFMAGRCFSCSHLGLGGPRVMNTTGQMGVVTGYAASLCRKYQVNPREIYFSHIDELKELIKNTGK